MSDWVRPAFLRDGDVFIWCDRAVTLVDQKPGKPSRRPGRWLIVELPNGVTCQLFYREDEYVLVV